MTTHRHAFALLLAAALLAGHTSLAHAQEPEWQPYTDPRLGYTIDLPVGTLDMLGEVDGRLMLEAAGQGAQLSVYGQENPDGLSVEEIAKGLESSDWVREVTYRKGGPTWQVLSGYYRQDAAAEDFIFYLKLMMKPDGSRYSVFAISYPLSEKQRFDPIIERLEASFRPPA